MTASQGQRPEDTMSSMKTTASVTAGVRSSLYESLLGKLSDEHQALLSELGSARL